MDQAQVQGLGFRFDGSCMRIKSLEVAASWTGGRDVYVSLIMVVGCL